jgi:protein gp37
MIVPLLGPVGDFDPTGIDWVIVGGESGAGARPMKRRWVREIRDKCIDVGVPFFFKQSGSCFKKEIGRKLDGRFWNQYPK